MFNFKPPPVWGTALGFRCFFFSPNYAHSQKDSKFLCSSSDYWARFILSSFHNWAIRFMQEDLHLPPLGRPRVSLLFLHETSRTTPLGPVSRSETATGPSPDHTLAESSLFTMAPGIHWSIRLRSASACPCYILSTVSLSWWQGGGGSPLHQAWPQCC